MRNLRINVQLVINKYLNTQADAEKHAGTRHLFGRPTILKLRLRGQHRCTERQPC